MSWKCRDQDRKPLVFVSLTVFFAGTDQSKCSRQPINCPCGNKGKNFSVCVENTNLKDPCVRWTSCKSCRDGLERCWECPKGREGPFCNQEANEMVHSRVKRQSSRSRLPKPQRKLESAVEVKSVYRRDAEEAFCDNLGPISLGQVVLESNSAATDTTLDDPEFPQGTQLQHWCNAGYELDGPESVTCEESGFWSDEQPVCRSVSSTFSLSCDDPGPLSNGRVLSFLPWSGQGSDSYGYPAGTRLEYSCNEGYTLIGTPTLSCEPSGFWSDGRPTCRLVCGRTFVKNRDRIRNGTESRIGEWPWVVAIKKNKSSRIFCVGALLDPTTVVTVAHCVEGSGSYKIYLGKVHYDDAKDDDAVEIRNISRIFIHPHFDDNSLSLDSDIALLVFEPRIRFTPRIQPICLPSAETTSQNLVIGKQGEVTGWRQFKSTMEQSSNTIRSNRECMEVYSGILSFKLNQNQFCAGNDTGEQILCSFLSGSTMNFYDRRRDRYTLEGLVSAGMWCGGEGHEYTIFTNIYKFVPWIRCRITQKECPVN